MVQITIRRRHLTIVTAIIALLIAVAWIGVASRASAASATPVVYVATGENFPDALGAASAAAVQGGPVLLVTRTSIPVETKDELTRLAPDVIYVAGGTAVVSDTVFNQLKAYAPTVQHVAGANRYATAVEVSKSAFPATGGAGTAALEARIHQLETLLAGVTRNGNTLTLTGMNLQIVNGEGSTESNNGTGNIIIGYNEAPSSTPAGYRDGSHYLIVGEGHTYRSAAGIVAGYQNTASSYGASVTGGRYNTASGVTASVTGGWGNTASGTSASVTGGNDNTASMDNSSITGGVRNTVLGMTASISGGADNAANAESSAICGGEHNTTGGSYSTVTGGSYNTAGASDTSVTGGYNNTAGVGHVTIVGGDNLNIGMIPWGTGAITYGEGDWYSADTND